MLTSCSFLVPPAIQVNLSFATRYFKANGGSEMNVGGDTPKISQLKLLTDIMDKVYPK